MSFFVFAFVVYLHLYVSAVNDNKGLNTPVDFCLPPHHTYPWRYIIALNERTV